MKKRKLLQRIILGLFAFVVVLAIGLIIYASNPYTALEEMDEQIELLDTSSVEVIDKNGYIKFQVDSPIKNIIFVPGGLVTSDSYSYLAMKLAIDGYNVTIIKPLLHLAIFTPNQAAKYIDDDIDNIIIGHSLGGVVASMVASKNEEISSVVLMGSYPIKDLSDKNVLFVAAQFDAGMDPDAFEESMQYVNNEAEVFDILGGNHAQFGWYGAQKGDGEPTITTLEQQTIVYNKIIDWIQ